MYHEIGVLTDGGSGKEKDAQNLLIFSKMYLYQLLWLDEDPKLGDDIPIVRHVRLG